jgi:AcrR family transcriptional regulator
MAARTPIQQRSLQTVERILDATSRVLATVPLAELTTTQVAHEAQVSVGGLYRFFPDKQALVDAIALRRVDEFAGLLESELSRMLFSDGASLLGAVVDAYIRFLDSHPDFRQIALGRHVSAQTRRYHVGPDVGITAVVKRFFTERFGFTISSELDLRLSIANEVGERLIAYAYEQESEESRQRVIAEMKRLLAGYLSL